MIQVEPKPWQEMVRHAEATYPNECVGAMLGHVQDGVKTVTQALSLENAYPGAQRAMYVLDPKDLLYADREADARGLSVIGIYHSHPDCDAYFSKTDLQNSVPWFSFIVLSIQQGEFHHANSWLPDADQTKADPEPLSHPNHLEPIAPAE